MIFSHSIERNQKSSRLKLNNSSSDIESSGNKLSSIPISHIYHRSRIYFFGIRTWLTTWHIILLKNLFVWKLSVISRSEAVNFFHIPKVILWKENTTGDFQTNMKSFETEFSQQKRKEEKLYPLLDGFNKITSNEMT